MERLTNSIDYCQMHCDFGKEKDCMFSDKSKCYENNMYNRLREYEIAEEQGLLLMLPCKVGDTVYAIVNNEILEDVVDDYDIWSIKSGLHLRVQLRNYKDYVVGAFGKDIFLTKEEEEQALADMKG